MKTRQTLLQNNKSDCQPARNPKINRMDCPYSHWSRSQMPTLQSTVWMLWSGQAPRLISSRQTIGEWTHITVLKRITYHYNKECEYNRYNILRYKHIKQCLLPFLQGNALLRGLLRLCGCAAAGKTHTCSWSKGKCYTQVAKGKTAVGGPGI